MGTCHSVCVVCACGLCDCVVYVQTSCYLYILSLHVCMSFQDEMDRKLYFTL